MLIVGFARIVPVITKAVVPFWIPTSTPTVTHCLRSSWNARAP